MIHQMKYLNRFVMKKPALPEIEITLDDIKILMGDSYEFFPRMVENCFCAKCEKSVTTIVMYRSYLNPLQDIILKGQCARCGNPVGRYIETGENKESTEAAKQIRKIIKMYRNGKAEE